MPGGLVLHTQWQWLQWGRGPLSSLPQSREAKLRPLPRLGFSRFCDKHFLSHHQSKSSWLPTCCSLWP